MVVLTSSVPPLPLPSSTSGHRNAGARSGHRKSAWSGSSTARLAMSSSPNPAPKATALSMEFPYLQPVHRELMADLLSSMDARVGSHLLRSDPLAFQNKAGTSKGDLRFFTGAPGSPVDCIFSSWLHCEVPSGVLNVTTVSSFLNPSVSSAPHLLLEFIQSSPTSIVLVLDLLPRKDLVLHQDYLHTFYEETQLDAHRRSVHSLPYAKPYVSPNLLLRSIISPTAILVSIGCDGEREMEGTVWPCLAKAAKGVVATWLDVCCDGSRGCGGGVAEAEELRKRDVLIKRIAIEMDLETSLPKVFGQEMPEVISAAQKGFGLQTNNFPLQSSSSRR